MATPHLEAASKRACHECNRKKTKCDMQRPTCQLCTRSGIECIYPVHRKPSNRIGVARTTGPKSESRLVRLIRLWEHENELTSELGSHGEDRRNVKLQLTTAIERLLTSVSGDAPSRRRSSISTAEAASPPAETSASMSEDMDNISSVLGWPTPPSSSTAVRQIERHDEETRCLHPSALPAVECSVVQEGHSISGAVLQPRHQQHLQARHQSPLPLGISGRLAYELIDLYFLKIQPWLPLLHRPNFHKWIAETINMEEGLISEQSGPQGEFLLSSLMALSARFSSDLFFKGIPAPERGRLFADHARVLQKQLDASLSHTLTYLQGCILLAFHCYCSGPTAEGWIISGVCTRVAYELGLAEIDGSTWSPFQSVDDISKEEGRRAWWLVWELDSFASIISRRPFAIDRRGINTVLPVSDEDWFSGNIPRSCKLEYRLTTTWRTLRDNNIQYERAWLLAATHFFAVVCDRIQKKSEVRLEEVLAIANEIASFKLALPPCFRIDQEPLIWNNRTFPRCNWIIGTQIILMGCSYMLNFLKEEDANVGLACRVRAIELSRLLHQWSGDYVALASPLHAAGMLAPPLKSSRNSRDDAIISTSHELAQLFLHLCGEKWTLGSVVRECSRVLEKIEPLSAQEEQLAWRYALFFPNYGTVEFGQSESRIFVSNSNTIQKRTPNQVLSAVESSFDKHIQESRPTEMSMLPPVAQTGPESPATDIHLLPTSPGPHDWFNIFLEPSAAADETSTLSLSNAPNNNVSRVSFPYVNFLGTVT